VRIVFCISSYLEHSLALEEPRSGSALDLRSDLSLTPVWIRIERIAEPRCLGNVNTYQRMGGDYGGDGWKAVFGQKHGPLLLARM
jgi:hypothetical protein